MPLVTLLDETVLTPSMDLVSMDLLSIDSTICRLLR
jgi:hypothetical protein